MQFGFVRTCCAITSNFALIALINGASIHSASAAIVRFATSRGNIDFRLYETAAPGHAANLLAYINADRYDGTFIHRSADKAGGQDFVIQGGGFKILTSLRDEPLGSGYAAIDKFAEVQNEPGISNLRGTVALAKIGNDPNSGTSQWFINLDDNSFLDLPSNNEFTVFGRVVGDGLEVADEIAGLDVINANVGPFSEVPVNDINKVVAQQDIFNEDVVLLSDAFLLNIPAGDYNFNGKVNRTDLTFWQRAFGSTTEAETDGNGSGQVDGADFLIWQRTFPESSATAATGAVPEPSAATLLCGAAWWLAVRRRRRR